MSVTLKMLLIYASPSIIKVVKSRSMR